MDYVAMRHQLHVRRVVLGLTQRELAEHAGITQGMISQYERGTHIPTLITLDKWATALELHSSLSFYPIWKEGGTKDGVETNTDHVRDH